MPHMHGIDAAYACLYWMFCVWSVCLSVLGTPVSPTKTTGPTEIQFLGGWGANIYWAPRTFVDPRNHVLDSGAQFGVTWRIWLNNLCIAALLPYVRLLWPIVSVHTSIPKQLPPSPFHCSLQARLLQLSLSQPAQVTDHPAPADPELSRTCCC